MTLEDTAWHKASTKTTNQKLINTYLQKFQVSTQFRDHYDHVDLYKFDCENYPKVSLIKKERGFITSFKK